MRRIGNIKKGKVLKARIEPHEKLITASKEAMGFNIFEPEEDEGSGLGNGTSFVSILEGNETGEFIIFYDLGVEEETAEVHHVPPKEQLNQLHKNALEATLIISLGKEEIARFDLSKKD